MPEQSYARVGEPAPEFRLPANTAPEISLSDFRDRQDVVLYVYSKDGTAG
ncbi:MAG TPA: redoxin domain-containing protein [Chloroflexota bacterium]|nr:redoxin domain-containing protein [Chloroflexota bacterium]